MVFCKHAAAFVWRWPTAEEFALAGTGLEPDASAVATVGEWRTGVGFRVGVEVPVWGQAGNR
jgi:hypothetical protein